MRLLRSIKVDLGGAKEAQKGDPEVQGRQGPRLLVGQAISGKNLPKKQGSQPRKSWSNLC